jgi:alkanesulfonate monooxygenase SsuD/methylene tetrahydromethanopterin reductase-like flavin-dependent oxidoreductase (luciferase family)
MARLEETVVAAAGRAYPVWVGGSSPAVIRLAAARADGWNRWGGPAAAFAAQAAEVRREIEAFGRDPALFACTWGGLAVLARTRAEAEAKRDRLAGGAGAARERWPALVCGAPEEVAEVAAAYAAAGAAWVILGPIDSSDPENAAVIGEAARLVASPETGASL